MSTTTGRTVQVAAGAAIGAAAGYFLDPDNGRRRRHVARDRGLALVRRPARRVAGEARRKASYAEGALRGAFHEASTQGDQRDPARLNDQGLQAKVESEVFRAADSPKDAVNVNVEAGVVYLRGQLDSAEEIDHLVDSVRQVEGVGEIRSLLHLPGAEPPSKEGAPGVVASQG
jgi:hypothetical protein